MLDKLILITVQVQKYTKVLFYLDTFYVKQKIYDVGFRQNQLLSKEFTLNLCRRKKHTFIVLPDK